MSLLEKTMKEVSREHEIRLRMSYAEWREQIDESKQTRMNS
jgi:hypothetical protein